MMKLSHVITAIAVAGFLSANVYAQEMMSVESTAGAPQPRTPSMVVHEVAKPATAATKPGVNATSKVQSTLKDAPTKVLTENNALKPNAAPSPIYIPTTPTVEVSTALLDTTGNPYYDQLVKNAAAKYGVDPHLIFALMRQESGFHSRAVSYKGASGLMQLMPATARRFGVQNIFDPAQNIDGGTRYLRFLLNMFNGDVKLALAGYNAGENAVINYGYQVPPYRETQNYVKNISAKYSRTKQTSKAKPAPTQTTVAPEAITTSKGRLSNNY
ncbi:MAG: lytic transglycosylase domain-containing protein [Acidobacteriota bacterium]